MNDDERVAATLKLFEDSLKESESLGEEVLMEKQQVSVNFIFIIFFFLIFFL